MAEWWRHVAATCLLSAIALHFLYQPGGNARDDRRLVIGVISARDHFDHRAAIRHTWARGVAGLGVAGEGVAGEGVAGEGAELVFVVGSHDCPIPPADRLSPYHCEEWKVHEGDTHSVASKINVRKPPTTWPKQQCITGLGFTVLHPIIIHALGVSSRVKHHTQDPTRDPTSDHTIVLQDPEEVLESVAAGGECVEEDGYWYTKLSSPLLLPAGFEGEVKVAGSGEEFEIVCDILNGISKECEFKNSSVLSFKHTRTWRDIIKPFNEEACSAVSFKYSISEPDGLARHVSQSGVRASEWNRYTRAIAARVAEEQEEYRDLVIIPMQDHYHNLPDKLMGFSSWATEKYNSKFILKIDDDTFLNPARLGEVMAHEERADQVRVAWWSHFLYHRAVPTYGKWADVRYPGLTYPTFPSGAGYLMTGTFASTLVSMKHFLPRYGGEDVSMGIWASLVPQSEMVDVPCWVPGPACPEPVLVPQLTTEQMRERWLDYVGKMIRN